MLAIWIRRLRRKTPTLREKFLQEAESYLEQELLLNPAWPARTPAGPRAYSPRAAPDRTEPAG